MTRPLRIKYKNATYHAYSRGNRKERIFLDDCSAEFFLRRLGKCAERFEVSIHAYCVLSNHFHLLLTTPEPVISEFMHDLLTSYASYLVKRGWVGHVFAGRYSSQVVKEDRYLLQLARYIHLNPVKAGLAESPDLYPWSSWHAYASNRGGSGSGEMVSEGMGWLDTDLLLSKFHQERDVAAERFVEFVLQVMNEECDFPEEKMIARAILGSEVPADEVRAMLEGGKMPRRVTGGRELVKAAGLAEALQVVLEHYGLENLSKGPFEGLVDRATLLEARRVFIYLARRHTSARNADIAGVLGDVGETLVSHEYGRMKKLMESGEAGELPIEKLEISLAGRRTGLQ